MIMKKAIPFLLWLTALMLSGCGGNHDASSEAASSRPAAQVELRRIEIQTRATTEEVAGTIRSKRRATLEARVSGRITELPVTLGSKVGRNQLLVRLEAPELQARLAQAEASLEQAESDWKRISTLFDQQSVTRAEFESAYAQHRRAKGAADEARAMMSYVEVVAPFDALVTRKWTEVGDLAAPGKPLLEIEDPSMLQMEADVPEILAAAVERDARLRIHVDSREIEGVVMEIAPAADQASRTLKVKLDLPPTPGLRPGSFARLAVPVGENRSLLVPASAIVQRGQLEIVFTVINERARLHLVRTGKRFADQIEILSGVEAGETIVVRGASQLHDGQRVTAAAGAAPSGSSPVPGPGRE
jgi:RND family efflux transporter MFP subunit